MCDRFDPKPYTGGLLCKCGAAKKSHVGAAPKPPVVSHTRTASPTSHTHTRSDISVTAPTISSASRNPARAHSRSPSSLSRAPPPPSVSTTSTSSAVPLPAASPARQAPSRIASPTRSAHGILNDKKPEVARTSSKDKASRSVSPPAGRQVDADSKDVALPALEKKPSFLGRPGKPAPHRPPSASPSRFSSLLSFTSRSASVCTPSTSSVTPSLHASTSSSSSASASTSTSSYPPTSTRPSSSSATSTLSSTSPSLLHSSRTLPPVARLPSPPSIGHLTAPASFGRSHSSPPPVSNTSTVTTSSTSSTPSTIPSSPPTLIRPPSAGSFHSFIPVLRQTASHPSPTSLSLPASPDSPMLFDGNDNAAFASMTILSELTGSDSPIHDDAAYSSQPRGPRPQHAPPSRPRASAPAPPPSPFIQSKTLLSSSSAAATSSGHDVSDTTHSSIVSRIPGRISDPSQPHTGTIGVVHALGTISPLSSVIAASSTTSDSITPSALPKAPPFTIKSPLVHSRSSPDLHNVLSAAFRRTSNAPPTPPSRPPPASPTRIPRDSSPASRDPSPSGCRVRELSPAPLYSMDIGPVPRMRDHSPSQSSLCSLVPDSQKKESFSLASSSSSCLSSSSSSCSSSSSSSVQRHASPPRSRSPQRSFSPDSHALSSLLPSHHTQESNILPTATKIVSLEENNKTRMSHESATNISEQTITNETASPSLRPRPALFLHSRTDLESIDDGERLLGSKNKNLTLSLGHSSSSPNLRRISNAPPARPPPPSPSRGVRDPAQFPKDSPSTHKTPQLLSTADNSATSSSDDDDDEDRDKFVVSPSSLSTAVYHSNSWTPEGQYPLSMHHAILSMLAFRLPPPERLDDH